MSLKSSIELREDAIFIADSHFNKNRQQLKIFLKQLHNNTLTTTQLFLMGDIFDFLAPQIYYFRKQNQQMVDLLNELSKTIEIIYLEGNHDYNLQPLFPNILVISRKQQPLYCTYQNKKVSIAHGDIFTPFGYNLYSLIIRNKLFLNFLNFIDINNWLTKQIDRWLLQKNICSECIDFEKFSENRISLYSDDIDLIIEGHFHYGKQTNRYINIASLSCSKQYYFLHTNSFLKLKVQS